VGEGADAVASAVKDLLIAAGVIALSFGIVGAVVFGLDDQATFVSPPEIVAEEFVRALGSGRVESARNLLASEAEHGTSIPAVRRISSTFRSRVGHLDKVKGSVAERRGDTAIVRARIEAERESGELTLPVVRERGVWSVALTGDALRAVVQTPARGGAQR
jgi:hypothetical protein